MFKLDFADVKPSVANWFLIGLMALSFSIAAKYVVNRYDNQATRLVRDAVNTA